MRYFILLSLALLLNAGSYVFYQYSSLNSEKQILSIILLSAGLLIGAVNAMLYTKSLKGIALNTAYPFFSAGSLILVTIISYMLFKEPLTVQKTIGVFVLIAGVLLVSI